jgi:membrane fusion protein (multidrug efflux system)
LSAAYQTAQARVQQLSEMLGKTKIVAPMSGLVIKKFANAGEFVGPGGPVVMLGDMARAVVQVEIPDREIVKVHADQPVEARADAFPERTFHGVIDEVGTSANPTSRTFKVEAVLDNADLSLKNGMIVSVRILLEEVRALVAPQEALLGERDGNATVYIVDQDHARAVKVRTGRRLDRDVEILDGLTAGQDVVTYGQQALTDGQPVKTYKQ